MELTNDFIIDRPIDETWKVLTDLEFIAPCMPGAKLTEIEGEEYRGTVKVKVGPIAAQYKGKASFLEQDAVKRFAKLKAEGRDPRQGNANALVSATMEEITPESTKVTIHTDLKLSGKVASFGRGIIEDVSKKILGQFVENLRLKLEADGDPDVDPAAAGSATASPATASPATAAAATPKPATASAPSEFKAPAEADAPKIRKIDSPEAEPVNLLAVTGSPIFKRLLPVVGGVVVLMILRWLLGGRSN